jgi:hypothetical protein
MPTLIRMIDVIFDYNFIVSSSKAFIHSKRKKYYFFIYNLPNSDVTMRRTDQSKTKDGGSYVGPTRAVYTCSVCHLHSRKTTTSFRIK